MFIAVSSHTHTPASSSIVVLKSNHTVPVLVSTLGCNLASFFTSWWFGSVHVTEMAGGFPSRLYPHTNMKGSPTREACSDGPVSISGESIDEIRAWCYNGLLACMGLFKNYSSNSMQHFFKKCKSLAFLEEMQTNQAIISLMLQVILFK